MAKKKKKNKKRSASSMMALLDDAGATAESVTGAVVATKAEVRPEKDWRRKATCGVCLKTKQMIALDDVDEGWELPGHPDHLDREVCVNCIDDYKAREECALLVFDAMRKQLRTKDFAAHEVEQAVQIAWRTFAVAFDSKALVKMAKKLKVKHPWLKGKKAK